MLLSEFFSCVHLASIPIPRPATIISADIDPEYQNVAITTSHGLVFVYNFKSNKTTQIPVQSRSSRSWISTKFDITAICHQKAYELYSIIAEKPVQLRKTKSVSTSFPTVCSLSANIQFFGLVCKDTKTDSFSVTVYNRRNWTPVLTWKKTNYEYINFSPDGTTIFLLNDRQFVAFYTHTAFRRAALPVCRSSRDKQCIRITSDETTDHVAVTDCTTLRVWNVNHPKRPVQTMPGYIPPSIDVDGGACAMSRDGSRLVAAISGYNLGVWDVQNRSCIATLRGHSKVPSACAITPDLSTIFSVDDNAEVRKWHWQILDETSLEIPSQSNLQRICQSTASSAHSEKIGSVLEQAFARILSHPFLLDQSFIVDHISANNVKTAADLLAGHNIVLLAIRTGVITRENIPSLGGSRWFLQDNLYLPASKLVEECPGTLNAVFQHAEILGILGVEMAQTFRDAVPHLLSTRSTRHAGAEMIGKKVGGLAERVNKLQQRAILRLINDLAMSSETNLQNDAVHLADALKQLPGLIHVDDKCVMYTTITKCLLGFITLAGQAKGELSYVVAHLFMSFNAEDVISVGSQDVERTVGKVKQVDLSNLQLARYLFSQKIWGKMESSVADVILSIIRESGFGRVREVERALEKFIRDIEAGDESMALLDIGSSAWLSTEREACNELPASDVEIAGDDERLKKEEKEGESARDVVEYWLKYSAGTEQ